MGQKKPMNRAHGLLHTCKTVYICILPTTSMLLLLPFSYTACFNKWMSTEFFRSHTRYRASLRRGDHDCWCMMGMNTNHTFGQPFNCDSKDISRLPGSSAQEQNEIVLTADYIEWRLHNFSVPYIHPGHSHYKFTWMLLDAITYKKY